MNHPTRIFTAPILLSISLLLCGLNLSCQNSRLGRNSRDNSTVEKTENDPASQAIYNKKTKLLRNLDYPVNQLSSGASYIPDQIMVWYEGEELNRIEEIRAAGLQRFKNNFKVAKTCGCKGKFQIELYEIQGMDAKEEGDSGSNKAAKDLGIKEGDQQDNLYLLPDIPIESNQFAQAFGTMTSFTVEPSKRDGAPIVIAILDTGIDHRYQNQKVGGEPVLTFWENADDPVDGKDDPQDPFCLTDDIIGWDFVNNDNNPMDDHSHGTHLSGIVAQTIQNHQKSLNYQLMALKIMDANGVGNTFDAVCATLYAAEKGARVINASWGFYGENEKLLRRAIRYAASKGVVFVNAAGNEQADLAVTRYFPAVYALAPTNSLRSVMFVGALDQKGGLWPETNIRTEGINRDGFVASPGENIKSLIPMHLRNHVPPEKSGTSMATPVMSAIMANYIRTFPSHTPATIRQRVLDKIFNEVDSLNFVRDGITYPYYPVEWLDF